MKRRLLLYLHLSPKYWLRYLLIATSLVRSIVGNYRSVGEGVCELKIDYGAGYRVYFGQVGSVVVLLLCGGDKSTQDRDIKLAKEYWKDYAKREGSD